MTPETLHRVLCADLPFDECNFTANVFADVSTDDARTALLDGGFRDVARSGERRPSRPGRCTSRGTWRRSCACSLRLGCCTPCSPPCAAAAATSPSPAPSASPSRRAADSLVWQAVLTASVGVATGIVLGAIAGPMTWRIIAADLGVIAQPGRAGRRSGAGRRDRDGDRGALFRWDHAGGPPAFHSPSRCGRSERDGRAGLGGGGGTTSRHGGSALAGRRAIDSTGVIMTTLVDRQLPTHSHRERERRAHVPGTAPCVLPARRTRRGGVGRRRRGGGGDGRPAPGRDRAAGRCRVVGGGRVGARRSAPPRPFGTDRARRGDRGRSRPRWPPP